MKTVCFLIILSFCAVSASTLAQEKIILHERNTEIDLVLTKITAQTGTQFVYEKEIFSNKKVSLVASGEYIHTVLNKLFSNTDFEYKIFKNTVAIKRKENLNATTGRLQERSISGIVKDSTGNVLPGVSVTLKNRPSVGTATDLNGRYILEVPENVILVFKMTGFVSQEIATAGKLTIDVVLKEDLTQIEEVVVGAFGSTQKRKDMIGSVTTVKPGDLKVPASNLTTALAGRVAGLIGFQRSAEPGFDNADFFVRGVATFGTQNNPLILIDNIEMTVTDLARLQVDDLESFQVMKDATATAIYGARGANGVILVTTKRGKEGSTRISARFENSLSAPTRNIELADPITYMRLHNEAINTRRPDLPPLYSGDKIDRTGQPGTDRNLYPMTNWRDELILPYTMNQRVNLNLGGGGQIATYYVSGSLNRDRGLLRVDPRNNFNSNSTQQNFGLLSNVEVNLTKTARLLIRLSGNFDEYTGPIPGGSGMFQQTMRANPVLFPAYYEPDASTAHIQHIMFGNADGGSWLNPYASLMQGYNQWTRSNMNAALEYNQDLSFLTEGLKFRVMGNTTREANYVISRSYNPFYYGLSFYDPNTGEYRIDVMNPTGGTEYLNFNEAPPSVFSIMYLESTLNYSRTFSDKHTLTGMLVYMMRNRLTSGANSLQLSLPFRNMGVSGRASYNYDSRYYAEFNFGYNGSERFAANNRFGFFPSTGVAWSIHNEKFFPWKETLTNLRLRATYGLIGFDAIGSGADRFFYMSEVNMNDGNRGASFGMPILTGLPGISISRYQNNNISWETSVQQNYALEIGIKNNLTINLEAYQTYRNNILMARASIPTTMGLAATVQDNLGQGRIRGIDANFNYNKTFGSNLSLGLMGNFTFARSEYSIFEEPDYDEPYRSRIGYPYSQAWGYIAERLFIDDYDVENSPRQNFGAYGAGDIKYRDINGDGQITERDLVPIGLPTIPEIVYGFGFNGRYKAIDFGVFFQGLDRQSFWIDPRVGATAPFINGTQLMQAYADNYWSEDNRNIYALWPRLTADSSLGLGNNSQTNTWFMRNGSFLRLKQVEIGYNISQTFLQRFKMKGARIYVNGSNLFVWSAFKTWDPEMAGNGLAYPLQRIFNAAIQIQL